MTERIVLIGAGPMAIEYAKVLKSIKQPFIVVGNSGTSAKIFEETIGEPVITGGYDLWLETNPKIPSAAIIAVNENKLGLATIAMLDQGIKKILVEKPGAFTSAEIQAVCVKAIEKQGEVYVGYNRRFLASVIKAQEIIKDDGGVTSFSFEFTEWSHVVAALKKEEGVKAQWFLHNSTHVIDMAFYLGGSPMEISCYCGRKLDWHPSGSVYTGAGISKNGALFSYHANWEAPGRWWVEILTKKHRLIFKPLEKLQIQKIGSVAVDSVEIPDSLDLAFKPGLYKQVENFINGTLTFKISDQVQMTAIYDRMRSPKRVSGDQ